ncbi:hypothetical protein B0A48_02968 [Cryoendolithus antarcticus]|uniref:Uncharacterized protein n=1 Tax=Cryoendolithus antarcticus TaxID=1507870 RepID=A0A1V8TLT4_9PEZI|nr:hypothetical protein B0A48_02968 [Cryoendolithus antarcticus]
MRVVQLLSYACAAAAQSYPNTTTANNGTVSSLSQNTTSQTRASASTIASSLTSHAAGFFIAAGVGLSSTTRTDQSPSLTLRLTTSTFAGPVLTSNTSTVSTGTEVISISNVSDSRTGSGSQGALFSGTPTEGVTYSNTTRQQSTSVARLSAVNGTLKSSHSGNIFTTTFTSYYNATYAKVTETLTNTSWASASNAGQCWDEWQLYWKLHLPTPASLALSSGSEIFTTTRPLTFTETLHTILSPFTSTQTITSTLPTVIIAGGFTQTVAPSAVTSTITWLMSVVPTATITTTDFVTLTGPSVTFITRNSTYDPAWPTPSCSLPSVYAECQASWANYATAQAIPFPQPLPVNCPVNYMNMTSLPACYSRVAAGQASWSAEVLSTKSPRCTQASITGPLCTSLKDAYVLGSNYNLYPTALKYMPGFFSSGSISYVGAWSGQGWQWPSYQPLAPGCTVGCGRCAITGGVVQLLYFPPGLSHPATGPVVATTLGTTLTSPTNYISFESLYASDVCSGVGRTITSTILAIPESHTMSSLFATTKGCFAHLLNNPWYGTTVVGTASFNVSDLVHDTVPYSIYTSQPRCASEMFHAGCNPNGCRTDLPYQPLIVLEPGLLQELDPAWAPCSMDLRGLYDPPKALVPATAVAGVSTASDTTATVTATPGVSMSNPTPTATGGALPASTTTKVSAAPKQRTSSTSLLIEQPSSNGESPVATVVETSAAAQPAPGNTVPVASGQGETSAQGSGNTPIPQDPRVSLVISTPAAATVPAAGAADPTNPEPTSVTLVAGQTLQPGGSAVVVSGTTFTALPGGNGVDAIAQGTTSTLMPTSAPSQAPVSNTNSPVVNAGTIPTNGSPQAQPSATVIAGQTLSPGGASVVLSGTTFSALPGTSGVAAVAQGTTRTITPAPVPSGDPATTANGPIVVAANSPGNGSPPAQSSVTMVAGQTLSAGGSAIVVSGTTFTALPGSSGVAAVAHGSTKIISAIASTTGESNSASAGPSVVVVPADPAAESLITVAIPSSGAAAGRITLADGQVITAAATTLAPQATTLVRNGATLTLSSHSGNLVVNGKTITPGAVATTINGVALSVDPSGQLVDLGHTNTIATGSVPGTFIVDGNILFPGDPAVKIGDETFSVNAAGHLVEMQGSKTITLAPGSTSGVMVVDGTTISAGESPVTIGDEVYTVNSAGQLLEVASATPLALPQGAAVVVEGTTLRAGAPAQSIAGEVLSVNAAGQLVQINDPHDPGSLVSVIAGIVAAAAQATKAPETATTGSQSHSTTIGIGNGVGSTGISTVDPAAASTAAGSNSSGGARLWSGSRGLFGVVILMLVGLTI